MLKPCLLILAIGLGVGAQEPFQPLRLDAAATPDRASARADWIRMTNQRMEMSGKTLRVAQAGDGLTVVVTTREASKPRHAKPILTGKGEHALLFRSIVAEGFTRIVVQNPDTGQTWSARLEGGKPTLEF
jgi:hypothetical protein